MAEPAYKCKYCKKPFSLETAFMRHTCTQMQRAQLIQTPEGQQAYQLYKRWMELQRRTPPPAETFMTSMYYTSFTKLSAWVRETGINDPERYVEVLTKEKISPALWTHADAYAIYLDFHDRQATPADHAEITGRFLLELAKGNECEPAVVFKKYRVGEILELISQRRLSPWLLFCSKSFKAWVSDLRADERTLLMRAINPDFWAMKFERDPESVKLLREYAESLGI